MKNLIKKCSLAVGLLALCAAVITGCKSEPDYKTVRQEVMDLHDKVMGDGEKAVKNRMVLDTFARVKLKELKQIKPDLDTAEEKNKINLLIAKLSKADDNMMDWMHGFQPDIEGKSNAEAVKYFQGEMTKIKKLDNEYKHALDESDAYLKKFNLKPTSQEAKHDHSKH
ncbi:hypothetical protein [uncultured Pedobacter sp.]|uniref:hypothetical protein n=1 Tax=uncultured Pedobacter sp. TaxID=246139 RepID=UPI0025E0855A|nr:hypothetical protein [uncultured Pedobacter sp.]